MKNYETDVLIVGGGGAATAAAISAHEAGARTTIAVKGRFGVPGARGAGATSNPLADFWTIRTVGPKGGLFNPPDLVHRDMVQVGLGMADAKLCRIFVEEVADAIKRLRAMGLELQSKMLAVIPAVAKSGGTNNIVALQKAVIEKTNTHVIEHANLTDLLVERGRCFGAVGVNDAGEPFQIRAGAVVLATGGVGQLFKYSFNPPGNTGDGYAMALRAGAELFNMEFMQQGIATTWPCQAMVMLYEMPEPYRLFNRDGKSFVQNYLPEGVTLDEVSRCKAMHWPVSCRDKAIHLDRAIHGEALAGRATANDGVYLDLSSARRGFLPEMFVHYMAGFDIDLKRDLLQIQNHHHTSNGGIRVDVHGQSSVRGLFAAGEAMGYQGADRLGGTMLGGSQVFGFRAGRKAAEVSRERPDCRADSATLDRLLHEPLARLAEASGPARPGDLLEPLQRKMWAELLVDKDAASLSHALQFVLDDRERLAKRIRIIEPMDRVTALEHRNLLDVAEAIIRAASMRTESRGSHYRSDYPERDDAAWLTNIFVTRKNGQLSLEKKWVNEEWSDHPGDVRILPWG
ncbi:FAD-binding protein [Sorangium sp. So ce1182]|uniref:FAD-binding protein n=1 Tax=Sorangium sp. So ce1182 TaxID=3133334 RepID=UPI003F63B521